jgi:hypothetical protein
MRTQLRAGQSSAAGRAGRCQAKALSRAVQPQAKVKRKTLHLMRHGITELNEYLDRVGRSCWRRYIMQPKSSAKILV